MIAWAITHWRVLAAVATAGAILIIAGLIRSNGYQAGYAAAESAYQEAARMKDREYRRREAAAQDKVDTLTVQHLANEGRIASLEQRKVVNHEDILCGADQPVFTDRLLESINAIGRD